MTQRSRNVPDPPVWRDPVPAGGFVEKYDIKVITPLFGGGYTPGEVDTECIIRPAAIRGHLRFWWRATAGARFSRPEELAKAEADLWGSASQPGRVAIAVTVKQTGSLTQCGKFVQDAEGKYKRLPVFEKGWPAYALQPFQGELDERRTDVVKQPATARLNASFELWIWGASAAEAEEVRGAVAAWVRFGGLGARTRRGCGSIDCPAFSAWKPGSIDVARAEDLSLVHGAVALWGNAMNDPIAAWNSAVRAYQEFRQGEGVARTPRSQKGPGADPKTPGRSWWPEADSIRRITGRSSPRHGPTHAVQQGFPRADLGLPIIFHFKDNRAGDPSDATLSGPDDGRDRFASPVITKAVGVGNGSYKPLILVLNAPHAWHYGPARLDGRIPIDRTRIELTPQERNATKPLAGADVREALIRHVEKTWNTTREVLP